MEIIKARPEHFGAVYRLLCELEGGIMDEQVLHEIYLANLKNRDIHYILAVDGTDIQGFASMHIQNLLHHAGKAAEVQELIVCGGNRGYGVGGALFAYMKETARSNGCKLLEVCCNQIRTRSHEFYIKQGMQNSHFKFTLSLKDA